MNTDVRFIGMSGLLLGMSLPVSKVMRRSYGRDAGRSFLAGMSATLVVQQALVGLTLRRTSRQEPHWLNLVDLITLSRGGAAALLIGLIASRVRDRRGAAGWMAWLAVLYGAILCDWLDGPLARHRGVSEVGARFDLEADSWLTLCTAASAVTWGDLPVVVIVPPLMRYLLLFRPLRDDSYADAHVQEPRWVRPLGIMQMLLFIAALAPFSGRATYLAIRVITPIQTPLQVAGLLLLHNSRRV